MYSICLNAQDTIKMPKNDLLKREIERHFADVNKPPKTIQEAAESEISRILLFNMHTEVLKDSVAIYAFTIKVRGNKSKDIFKIAEIMSDDSLYYGLFPKSISMLQKINFGVFIKKEGFSQIIIPVAVIVTSHDKIPKDSTLDIWSIPKKIDALFGVGSKLKYESIFLNPQCILASKEIYN